MNDDPDNDAGLGLLIVGVTTMPLNATFLVAPLNELIVKLSL